MLAQSADATTDDAFRGSPLQCTTRLFGPSPATRLVARLRLAMLDRALTDGADPAASPLIAARSRQLSGRCTRTRIADGLERLAESVYPAAAPGSCRHVPP